MPANQPPAPPVKCFTVTANGQRNVLATEASVFAKPSNDSNEGKKFEVIWDTGASKSAITIDVVQALDLKPIGRTVTQTAHGPRECNVFLVSIMLPNGMGFRNVTVTEVELVGKYNLLIGMDIIGTGDFAVTNLGGKTVFSFRCPSMIHIDFVKEFNAQNAPGRNDPCFCGSGKKYKQCCRP